MCPCPVCATLALLLLPFMGYKWAKRFIKKHHCSCQMCQQEEHQVDEKTSSKCSCAACAKQSKGKKEKKGK